MNRTFASYSSRIVTIVLVIPLFFTFIGDAQLIPPMYATSGDPMEKFACEVLINPDRIGHDLAPLEELVDTGSVLKVDIGKPSLDIVHAEDNLEPQEEFFNIEDEGYPPGVYYIYRSSYETQMAVVLTEVDDTAFVEELYPDIDEEGLSISFIAPASMKEVNRSAVKAEIPINDSMELNSTLSFLAESLGYFAFPLRDLGNEPAGFTFVKGNSTIQIFDEPPRGLNTDLRSGMIAVVDSLREVEAIKADMSTLLDHAGVNRTLAETATFNPSTRYVQDITSDMDKGIDEIDWQELVRYELDHLVSMGVLEGITGQDIDDISELAAPGVSGIQHRIMELDGEWARTDDVLLIPSLGGNMPEDGSNSRFFFDIDRLPDPLPEIEVEELPDLMGIVMVVSILTIYLTAASVFLFARHSRDELLDNINRKALFDAIKDDPGIHYKALQRKLGLKQGVLSYHLNKLEKNEIIKSVQEGNRRRFYLFDDRIDLQFRLHEVQENILALIIKRPGLSQTKISKRLGRNKMVVNYHLRILSDAGIVSFEREGREYQYFGTSAAEDLLSAA